MNRGLRESGDDRRKTKSQDKEKLFHIEFVFYLDKKYFKINLKVKKSIICVKF